MFGHDGLLGLALATTRGRLGNINTNCQQAFVKSAASLLVEMGEVDGNFVAKFGSHLFKREPVGFREAPQEWEAG